MMKKTALILAILAFLLLNLTIAYGTYINNNNIQSYFRVHITANSDSIDDQLLKYNISKEVNSYIEEITKNVKTKEQAKKLIEENIYNILNISKDIITKNNFNYNVKAYIGKIEYDKKTYNELEMQKGIYDSLKITIGEGKGSNWWSLIYPTYTEEEILDENTEYSLFIVDFIKELLKKKQLGIASKLSLDNLNSSLRYNTYALTKLSCVTLYKTHIPAPQVASATILYKV